MDCLSIIGGILLAVLFNVILYIINQILGVLWTLWMIGAVIYVFKFKKP